MTVQVFDNLIGAARRNQIYTYVAQSLYRVGWEDTNAIETAHHKYLHSRYSPQNIDDLGLVEDLKNSDVGKIIEGKALEACVVNLSNPSDQHWVHTHNKKHTVVLYYANLEWNKSWAGETLFFDDAGDEIIFASVYKPGRIIIFNGAVPHTIRPQSVGAPQYRFSISMFWVG